VSFEYKKFHEMEIWKEAFTLQKEVFDLTKAFPRSEEHGLIGQLNRSTNSVCANFAESHGRFYYADKVRVLYIARGEIEETQSHLMVAASRQYIPKEKSDQIISNYESVKIKINRYISVLMEDKKFKE